MRAGKPDQTDYSAAMQSWPALAVVSPRHALLGLQGKLIVCFMFLLLIALGGSYWLFLRETRDACGGARRARRGARADAWRMAATGPLEAATSPS